MSQWVTKALAKWALALDPNNLPEDVLAKAEDCIIDAIGCAIVGRKVDGARRVHKVAKSTYQKGHAALWFDDMHLHPTGAAFANAASSSILDIDDGHRHALGHPGAAVVPAALAVATPELRGIKLLTNIVAGYEVCIRIGRSERRKAYHTGNWSGFGAAVVAGRTAGLTEDQLMNALAITAYHAPRVTDLTLSNDMGTNVKESIPWSVVAGMTAADLAAQEFTGCRDALEIEERYNRGMACEGLSSGVFPSITSGDPPSGIDQYSHAILRTYFKRYACCRWIHSAIEGLLAIIQEHDLSSLAITAVRVETFLQAANLNNLADPPSLESAQYSVPFCMGVAATLGENALAPLSIDNLHFPPAVNFANKIKVEHVEEMDFEFPAKSPTKVIVTTASSRFEKFITMPWGDPDVSPDRSDLVAKFHMLANGRISKIQATDILGAVAGLRNGSAKPLLDALKRY